MSEEFQIGDLVWAKMKSYTPWPGRITAPNDRFKRPNKKGLCHFIYFFGTKDYAWIEIENIKEYVKYREKFSSMKSRGLKNAISDIEDYIKRKEENPDLDLEKEDQIDSTFNRLKDSDSEQEITPKKPKKQSTSSGKRSASKSSTSNSTPSKKIRTEENGSSPPALSSSIKHFREIINRPSVEDLVETPKIDINDVSDTFRTKNIEASKLSFGFLGLGLMGSGIVKNLINSGHKVNLYSRSKKKEDEIIAQSEINHPGMVKKFDVPSEVLQNSDIIFCCVSDPAAAKDMVEGNCGLLDDVDSLDGKGYVEMSTIDPETSMDINNMITGKGGRYLEAQMQGSKTEANDGNLIILGAGDKSLFHDCNTCFKAIAKAIYYLGDVGFACKMNLAIQVMKGIALAGIAEGFALADRAGISPEDVMEIFTLTGLNCSYLKEKANTIINTDFKNVEQSVQHMQKDLRLAIQLADSLMQPLVLASTANEVYKHVRRLGYESHDASAVYMRSRY